jgi:WD40 repeat protein
LLTYQGHQNFVTSIAWSPDGKLIASGSYDATVQIWNATSGERLFPYDQREIVLTIAWSPNGKLIASGGTEQITGNSVQVWDATSGHMLIQGFAPQSQYVSRQHSSSLLDCGHWLLMAA